LEHIGKKNKSKESDKEKYRSRIGKMVGLGCQLRHSHIQLLSQLLAWLFSLAIALFSAQSSSWMSLHPRSPNHRPQRTACWKDGSY
jgi:hypothetical protein